MKKTLSKLIKNYSKANWKLIILHSAGSLSFFQLNLTRCIGQRVLAFGFAFFFDFLIKTKYRRIMDCGKYFYAKCFPHIYQLIGFLYCKYWIEFINMQRFMQVFILLRVHYIRFDEYTGVSLAGWPVQNRPVRHVKPNVFEVWKDQWENSSEKC